MTQYREGSDAGSAYRSGRLDEGSSTGATDIGSPFGNVGNYAVCAGCGCFHAVFDGGNNEAQGFLNADDRGSFGPNGRASFNPREAGAQIARGNLSWAEGPGLGQPVTITFAFRSTAPTVMPGTSGFSRFNETQISTTLQALASWSDVANITFLRVTGTVGEESYSNEATILFSNYSTGAPGAAAFAYLPGNRDNASVSGDVWVNNTLSYNQAPLSLSRGHFVLTHEIGHTIGLRHPGDYNASAGGVITYDDNAVYYEDSRQYSVMSYFGEAFTGASFVRANGPQNHPVAPMLDDIAAAQRLYGANMTTRTGDTVYGFNSTAVQPWFNAINGDSVLIFAIWDAGGIDTLDFSGFAQTQVIDLRQGAFSNVGGLIGNIAIAVGAVIENAIGGSGADRLIGNSADNVLTGNAGDDRIDGGLGIDTAVFNRTQSEYTIVVNGQTVTVTHVSEGTDTLVNVERLQFLDQTIEAGTSGALTLSGDILNNLLEGTALNDTLSGLGGNDTLNGRAGNDRLDGGFGNDTISGGAGNDVVIGGLGDDTLTGGAGVDVADYFGADGSVQVDLSRGEATGAAGRDTLTGFENLQGSLHDDVLTGDDGANTLLGGGGSDILRGGAGSDILIAGSPWPTGTAPDIIKSRSTANSTIATAIDTAGGFDLQARTGVRDATTIPHATVLGTSHGGPEYYAVTVAAGDTVQFDIDYASFDSVLRLFDADGVELAQIDGAKPGTSDAGSRTDSFLEYTFETAGTYYIQVSAWLANSGLGVFTSQPAPVGSVYQLNISVPSAPVPTVQVGSILNGEDGDDVLLGNAGNDTLNGGSGSDTIDGGAGVDTLILSDAAQFYVFERAGPEWRVTDRAGTADRVSNIERVSFAGAGAVNLERAFAEWTFDAYRYMAGYADLLAAFRDNPSAATRHYLDVGRAEGRAATSFNGLQYIASNPDLIRAFGADSIAGARHYVQHGSLEGRSTSTFNALDYAASHPDLARAFGADALSATAHFVSTGFAEGRSTTGFNSLLYLASNPDLFRTIGSNQSPSEWHDIAVRHYLDVGAQSQGPVYRFDPLLYAASNTDLARAFGTDGAQALWHYLSYGIAEGRPTAGFDARLYAASHLDLARAFGADTRQALNHYLSYGAGEGRVTSGFDSVAYLLTNRDLAGLGAPGALAHWLAIGADEGRSGDAAFGRDQTAHAFQFTTEGALEQPGDQDWFDTYLPQRWITINLTDPGMTIELYDLLGNQIASEPGRASNVFNIRTAGDYYIVVSGSTGAFTLNLIFGSSFLQLEAGETEGIVSCFLPSNDDKVSTLILDDVRQSDDAYFLQRAGDLLPSVLPAIEDSMMLLSQSVSVPPTGDSRLAWLPDDRDVSGHADFWHRVQPEDDWMLQ